MAEETKCPHKTGTTYKGCVFCRIASLQAEVAAYKDQNERIAEMRIEDCERAEKAEASSSRLLRECEGLREALDTIANGNVPPHFLDGFENWSKEEFKGKMFTWCQETARAALSRQEPAPKPETCCKDWPHDDERHGHAIPPEAVTPESIDPKLALFRELVRRRAQVSLALLKAAEVLYPRDVCNRLILDLKVNFDEKVMHDLKDAVDKAYADARATSPTTEPKFEKPEAATKPKEPFFCCGDESNPCHPIGDYCSKGRPVPSSPSAPDGKELSAEIREVLEWAGREGPCPYHQPKITSGCGYCAWDILAAEVRRLHKMNQERKS